MQTEHEFDPGQAPAYPLPQREPWETFARWGNPPEQPGAYERPWNNDVHRDPAVQHGWRTTSGPRQRRGAPRWALAAVMAGSMLTMFTIVVLIALYG